MACHAQGVQITTPLAQRNKTNTLTVNANLNIDGQCVSVTNSRITTRGEQQALYNLNSRTNNVRPTDTCINFTQLMTILQDHNTSALFSPISVYLGGFCCAAVAVTTHYGHEQFWTHCNITHPLSDYVPRDL